jgi:type VI secretion system (T6SS) effector TldE1-like protein
MPEGWLDKFAKIARNFAAYDPKGSVRPPIICRTSIHMIRPGFSRLGGTARDAIGDRMRRDTMIADAGHRRRSLVGPSAAIVAALAAASAAAIWISDPISATSAPPEATDQPVSRIERSFFDLRFSVHQARRPSASDVKLQIANVLLAQKPTYEGVSKIVPDEPAEAEAETESEKTVVAAIPLPRSRPSDANLAVRDATPAPRDNEASRSDDPTLLQKLSGLFRYRFTLASLTPNDGLFASSPDLASLGYDGQTAVYDISAHVVYLPNGSKLEAHSGLGESRDDPRHVSERKVGSTPPAVYELKPREALFHGVQALRMLPVEGSALGRTGLLVHSYMLGPDGDSNGCVSVRDYDRFLAAYQRGEFKRLAVVSTLPAPTRQSSL